MSVRLEAIVPKKMPPYDTRAISEAIRQGLADAGEIVKADFKKTTRTWSHQPRFRARSSRRGQSVSLTVETNDRVYQMVSYGTKPHYIVPRSRQSLRFGPSYRAKTTPGLISSRQGYSRGRAVYTREVLHPGVEARYFDIYIKERHERLRTLPRAIQARLNEALRRTTNADSDTKK